MPCENVRQKAVWMDPLIHVCFFLSFFAIYPQWSLSLTILASLIEYSLQIVRQLNKIYTCTYVHLYVYVSINLPCEHILQEKFKHEVSRNNIIAKVTAKVFFCVFFLCAYMYVYIYISPPPPLDSEGGKGRTIGDRLYCEPRFKFPGWSFFCINPHDTVVCSLIEVAELPVCHWAYLGNWWKCLFTNFSWGCNTLCFLMQRPHIWPLFLLTYLGSHYLQ